VRSRGLVKLASLVPPYITLDILSSILVSLLLLGSATALMLRHVRVWRRSQRQPLDPSELDYQRRQFRRRMQTSAMLGVLAVAILVGSLLTGPPLVVTAFWIAVLLTACWVALLAMTDVLATQLHFGRQRSRDLVEQAQLQSALRRLRSVRNNGQGREEGKEPPGA
jgi:hypothetical protein